MKVVNYSEAARLAGVSRQMITKMKNAHIKGKSKKSFFVFDPVDGKPGVDIEDRQWIKYVNTNCQHRKHNIDTLKTTEVQPIEIDKEKYVLKINFATAVVRAIKKKYGFQKKEMDDLIQLMEKEYEKIVQ